MKIQITISEAWPNQDKPIVVAHELTREWPLNRDMLREALNASVLKAHEVGESVLFGGPKPRALTSGEAVEATDADVEAVESALGMGCGAWDMVSPKKILEAAWTLRAPSRTEREDTAPEVGGKGKL